MDDATIWGIDPGATDTFVTVDGDDGNLHRIRTTATIEYYHFCAFNAASRERLCWKHQDLLIRNIVDRISTLKTSRQDILFWLSPTYTLILCYQDFYDRDFRFSKLKLKNCGNKQRASSEISRRLII